MQVVDPVAGAVVDAQLGDATSDRLDVAGVAGGQSLDADQDPRGAPDLMPIWTILDATPEGRGKDWYPKLDYSAR